MRQAGTNTRPKTIQIFLPSGEPRGLRIAEITTRTVQAVAVPRVRMAEATQREELRRPAVYFLFGEDETRARPQVYVGETDDGLARVTNHVSRKEFWNTAVAVVSRTQSFTKAHVKWLEWYCLEKCRDVGRYEDQNTQTPSEPFVTEPMQADLMDAFDTLEILLSTLGYAVFEPARGVGRRVTFHCTRGGADAKGVYSDDGMVVLAGSKARAKATRSAQAWIKDTREQLRSSGVLEVKGAELVFKSDFLFPSPSAAAAAVVGGSANGWIEWKDARGRTLSDVYRGGDAE